MFSQMSVILSTDGGGITDPRSLSGGAYTGGLVYQGGEYTREAVERVNQEVGGCTKAVYQVYPVEGTWVE